MKQRTGTVELKRHHAHQDIEEERGRQEVGERAEMRGEDSYKPWSDFGGQRPPPSCHFSYMQ